ncbi:hypothetical protein LDENG_00239720 [Lucifuga dentata]|nr:hypothetical protein LDENG_00239720 [Lucifuga dentata]
MLQMNLVGVSGRSLQLPTRIRSVCVDPALHQEKVSEYTEGKQAVDVHVNHCLDVTVAGGVRICGLHTTVAPRRQQQQSMPMLEEFVFVPYVQTDCLADDRKVADQLRLCRGLIHRLQQKLTSQGVKLVIPGLEGVSDSPLPNPEPSEPGLVRLLTLLCGLELNGNLESELEQTVEKEQVCLLQDGLLQGLLHHPALRHCLDIAMENTTPAKMKVLEALSNDGQLFSRVVALLNIQPMLHVDYTATATKLELMTPQQAILEELGVSSDQWDPRVSPAPGGAVGGADLVVCNHAWGPLRTDVGLLVSNLASGAKEGGFVLIHTLLKGGTLGETVAFLSSVSQSSNSQQGMLTQSEWEKVFSEASLNLVALRKSFYGSALFLCRRCLPNKQPVFLPVDNADYQWVEKLKVTLAESSDCPVWLTASQAHCGIVGMVNCLRQEPGGNRLR